MMNMKPIRWNFVLGLLFSLLFAGGICAFGQQETRASLGGRVTDPKGAVIPKATVTVTSDATGVTETTQTTQTGDWIVTFLVPGFYHFEVNAPGFKSEIRSSIELQVADQKFINTQMQIGADTQTITVQGTPLIDTSAAVSGTVVTTAEIDELETQTNSPTMIVGLVPGVTISGGVNGNNIYLWSNLGLSGTVVNNAGVGSGAINYAIDGANDANNAQDLAFEPPTDAVSEFRVVTNAYDAAIGRESSSTINLSMKAGTEKLHGDVYEFNQNNFLDAQPYLKPSNGVLRPFTPISMEAESAVPSGFRSSTMAGKGKPSSTTRFPASEISRQVFQAPCRFQPRWKGAVISANPTLRPRLGESKRRTILRFSIRIRGIPQRATEHKSALEEELLVPAADAQFHQFKPSTPLL